MKTLLIVYKIARDHGSEDGIGYHLCAEIVKRTSDVTVLSQTKNIELLAGDPAFSKVTLLPIDVDFPRWLKVNRFGKILYYILWQIKTGRLASKSNFAIIHQVNFAISWIPHFIRSRTGKIFWGPLMCHDVVPYSYWRSGVMSFITKELVPRFIKRLLWSCNPFLNNAIKASHRIFWSSPQIPVIFQKQNDRVVPLLAAGSFFSALKNISSDIFHVLYVGRFVDLKGCIMAAEIFRSFTMSLPPHLQSCTRMTMIGRGDLNRKLLTIAEDICQRTKARLIIEGWKPQHELPAIYASASLFLYPSFEAQGLTVAEALTAGCPVLCLAQTGPATIAGAAALTVEKGNYIKSFDNMLDKLKDISYNYWHKQETYQLMRQKAFDRAAELNWEQKAQMILESYND